MGEATLHVSRGQALAFRVARHHLAERLGPSRVDDAEPLAGASQAHLEGAVFRGAETGELKIGDETPIRNSRSS